jgi:hypothetical protein
MPLTQNLKVEAACTSELLAAVPTSISCKCPRTESILKFNILAGD